jgi:hypothetical protein
MLAIAKITTSFDHVHKIWMHRVMPINSLELAPA